MEALPVRAGGETRSVRVRGLEPQPRAANGTNSLDWTRCPENLIFPFRSLVLVRFTTHSVVENFLFCAHPVCRIHYLYHMPPMPCPD